MKVGDIIIITELKTSKQWEERIQSGSPPAGLFISESGIPFWASGIQWISDKQLERGETRNYSCTIKNEEICGLK